MLPSHEIWIAHNTQLPPSLPGCICRTRPTASVVLVHPLTHICSKSAMVKLKVLILRSEIYTEITEVNLSAFAYRLFNEDFSSIDETPLSTQPRVIPEQI